MKPAQPEKLTRILPQSYWDFSLYQVIRMLLRLKSQPGKSEAYSPLRAGDVLRFSSHCSLAFPPSDITSIEISEDGSSPPEITQALLGLCGPGGPLPDHYTEHLIHLAQKKDRALRDFLNIFEHRLTTLFYAAWERPRFYIHAERGHIDVVNRMLLALIGLDDPVVRRLLPFPVEVLVAHGVSISRRPVSTDVAHKVISRFLGHIPIELIPFEGKWIEIEKDSQLRLRGRASGTPIGEGCVLGRRYWDIQGQIRLRLGPMSESDYHELVPSGEKGKQVTALLGWLCGSQYQIVTELVVRAGETDGVKMASSPSGRGKLGEAAWLGAPRRDRHLAILFGGGAVRRSWSI